MSETLLINHIPQFLRQHTLEPLFGTFGYINPRKSPASPKCLLANAGHTAWNSYALQAVAHAFMAKVLLHLVEMVVTKSPATNSKQNQKNQCFLYIHIIVKDLSSK